jgi:hypothetical protein
VSWFRATVKEKSSSRPITIPNELLLQISKFLEPKDMNTLILTCRQLHDTFKNPLYRHAVGHCPDLIKAWVGEKGQVNTMREFAKAGGDVIKGRLC